MSLVFGRLAALPLLLYTAISVGHLVPSCSGAAASPWLPSLGFECAMQLGRLPSQWIQACMPTLTCSCVQFRSYCSGSTPFHGRDLKLTSRVSWSNQIRPPTSFWGCSPFPFKVAIAYSGRRAKCYPWKRLEKASFYIWGN